VQNEECHYYALNADKSQFEAGLSILKACEEPKKGKSEIKAKHLWVLVIMSIIQQQIT
jgi:hypothetical protein